VSGKIVSALKLLKIFKHVT